jgi:hypothetical protein
VARRIRLVHTFATNAALNCLPDFDFGRQIATLVAAKIRNQQTASVLWLTKSQ